jgi:nucleoside-diphosphate-sugar epimerase
MLQQEAPCDLVFGTGETHSVAEFVEEAFGYVNLDWRAYVTEDPRYRRPTEVSLLQADPSEAKRCLGWEPTRKNGVTRYTRYWNQRYRKVGHLFQGRHTAILCEKERYVLALVRYT